MVYSEADIQELRRARLEVQQLLYDQMMRYQTVGLKDERAREFSVHGYLRRLLTLRECLDQVYDLIPPDSKFAQAKSEVAKATVFLQAFFVHLYGCIENLAWIWVCETGLLNASGTRLRHRNVGLRRANDQVRKSLSSNFVNLLDSFESWFSYLENYRHSLAHRIPLYIPAHLVRKSDNSEFMYIERKIAHAILSGDGNEEQRLRIAQQRLSKPLTLATHSVGWEPATPIQYHAQMLADLRTVLEIGELMHKELLAFGQRK
jgi:hypothetical protein